MVSSRQWIVVAVNCGGSGLRWQWIVEAAVVGTNTSVTCDVDTPGGEAGHRYRGRLAGLQLYRRLPTTTTSFPGDVGGSAGYFGIDDCESGTADPTAARMPRRLIANGSSWPIGYTQLDVSGTDELAGGLDKLLQRPITYPTRIIQAFQPRVADIAAQGSGLDPELGRRGWFTYFPMICSAIFGIMHEHVRPTGHLTASNLPTSRRRGHAFSDPIIDKTARFRRRRLTI